MNSINEVLEGAKAVAITGHIRPDGDCAGSTLGLYNYLLENMPELEVYLKDANTLSQGRKTKYLLIYYLLIYL